MINEYLAKRTTWVQAAGNLYMLRPSAYDDGGQAINAESNRFLQNQAGYVYYALGMSNQSRVIVGGTFSSANISYQGYNIQRDASAIDFSASGGYGVVDFATSTGSAVLGEIDTIETPYLYVRNRTDTTSAGSGPWAKTKTNWISGTQDSSAYTVRSTGAIDVQGDMSAYVLAESGDTMLPGGTAGGTKLDYIADYSGTDTKYIDFGTGNTSNSAAFRGTSLSVENNFTSVAYGNTDGFVITKLRNSGNISNNTISAYGIWVDNAIEIAGVFYGSTVANVNNIVLANDVSVVEEGKAIKVAYADNDITAAGMSATSIKLGSFKANGTSSNIYARIANVTIFGTNTSGDGAGLTLSNHDILAMGISTGTLTVDGAFTGSIQAFMSNVLFDSDGFGTHTSANNTLGTYGIRATDSITVNDNMGGSITIGYSNSRPTFVTSIDTYGIQAKTFSVAGVFHTDISVAFSSSMSNYTVSPDDYICGVNVNNLTAASFAGTITVTKNNVSPYSLVTVGMYIVNGIDNGNDGIFDICGNITVQGYNSVGVMGFQQKEAPMNLRVSGNVISDRYSFFAGKVSSYTLIRTRYGTDDRLEVAAGAIVVGDIELYNGKNALIIDSNARVNGNVNADFGTVNIEFVLNNYAMGGVSVASGYENDAILHSDIILNSTVTLTVNMNGVDFSQNGGYQEIKLYSGNIDGWDSRTLDFKYQGLTARMNALNGSGTIGGVNVRTEVRGTGGTTEVYFIINSPTGEAPIGATVLQAVTGLVSKSDADARTVTLSWDSTGSNSYEVEYRIDGGKTIVQVVSGKTSITLNKIEAGQEIEWRIRQNVGQGDQTSAWTGGDPVTLGEEGYVYNKVTNADYILGESAASAVSTLTWDPGEEYTEGLKGYVVRYFQTIERLENIDWNSTACMVKYVTNNELLVSGLNNLQYFYWQVQAVDRVDSNGNWIIDDNNWVDGQLFKVYADDNTPPWFVNPGSTVTPSVGWVVPASFSETHTMNPALKWNKAYDDRSGVSRYTIKFRLSGSSDEWTVIEIPVTSDAKEKYTFVLSEYIAAHPESGLSLLTNGNYEYQLTATDYVGKVSNPVTGTWYGDSIAPIFPTSSVEYVSVWQDGSRPLSISVAWDPASDEEGGSGLFYYQLKYKASTCGSWTIIDMPTSDLSISLSLTNAAYYDYELSAFDVAGNRSSVASGVWYGDSVAPTFDDTSAITVNNSYNPTSKSSVLLFNWSTATDSSFGPISGFAYYELAYYNASGTRIVLGVYDEETLSAEITVGKGKNISGLADGYYDWSITAYDNAGNGREYFGDDFLIDTQAPTGAFHSPTLTGHATLISTGSTQQTVLPAFGGTPVEVGTPTYTWTITDIWVTFTFNADFIDNSGEVYYILQMSDNATFTGNNTYEFTTDQDTLTLDHTNGYGAGAMIGNGRFIYWRIQAMDSSGNRTGAWTQGMPFYFVSETTGEYIPLVDTTIPTSVTSTTVTVTDKNTVNTAKLTWSASYDLFGVESYEITYSAKGVAKKTITVSATDTSYILKFQNGTADGLYSWTIRAVDYVGNKSDWFSGTQFLIDTINPVFNASSFKIISVQGAQDIGFTWAAAIDANLYYYQIEVTASNGEISYIETDQTNFWVYNQPNGLYSFRVRAVDLLGNSSVWSDVRKFMVDTTADPGSTFETAAPLAFTGSRETMVGGSDSADMFKLTLSNAATVTITLANVETLEGKNTGVKVNVYNSSHKKLKSISVKSGTKSLDVLLDAVGPGTNYYVEVVSASGNASVAKYTISATKEDFETPGSNRDWTSAERITLTGGSGSVADGWVGFGDAADYYKFTTDFAGSISIDFTGIGSTTNLKVSLYVLVNGKYKQMASTTVKYDTDNIFRKNVLAQAGEYYLVVEAGDKGKGQYNSGYGFSIDDSYYQAPSGNSNWQIPEEITLVGGSGSFTDGWVGFGDPADYYRFNTTAAGAVNVDISGLDPNTSLKVSLYALVDGKYKKMASVTVKSDMNDIFKKDVLAQAGEYYLVVESGDNGKGKFNSYYDITVNDDYFPVEATPNNILADAEEKVLSTVMNTDVSGWVGFGDPADFYLLKANGPGSINFSFSVLEAGMKIQVSLYDLNGKKIKSYTVTDTKPLLVENMLLANDCYLVVESGDKGKGKFNTGYLGSVVYNEFPAEATSNNTLGLATSVNFTGAVAEANDWVGYGDNIDFFAFELDANGRVDLDLALGNTGLRVGKEVKVKLYSEDGKLLKLDSNLMSNQLEAGKYAVSVEITKPEQNWTGYDLGITKLA